MNKYTYYNQTSSSYETILSDVQPTECLNNADTFDATSLSVSSETVLINDGTPVHQQSTLAAYKQLRYNEIDGKTGVLIGAGFVYDTKTFSLSDRAQFNWNILKTHEAEFAWPKAISTIDNDSYDLAQVNLSAFWTTAKDTINGHLDSGRALKAQVKVAVDKAAVDAIIDNR